LLNAAAVINRGDMHKVTLVCGSILICLSILSPNLRADEAAATQAQADTTSKPRLRIQELEADHAERKPLLNFVGNQFLRLLKLRR
jgi:hypothetical protein